MQPIQFEIDKICHKKIIVFGDFMVDEYLQGSVSRISPEAPVPVVNVTKKTRRLGGAGNVVLNLKALGAQVVAMGCFGQDAEGEWLMGCLKEHGVDVCGILQSGKVTTSIKTRVTALNQQLLRYDQETIRDVAKDFITFMEDRIDSALRDSCAVIISDYGKGVVTEETAQIMIKRAEKYDIPVVVDPRGSNYGKYCGAFVCTPNMKELQLAVGMDLFTEEDIVTAGRKLYTTCGIKYTLATRSERGMSLICGETGEKNDYPALAKEVTDVTGAGDTVVSVFTLALSLGASYADCCRLANLAASVVVSKFGAATVTPKELLEVMAVQPFWDVKVLTKEAAKKKAEILRAQGKKIIFTNGCFDLVHAGHISSFRQARRFGDVLFLGVNSDDSVRRLKGENRPIIAQENRITLLSAISYIDYIVLFDEDTPEELIQAIKPDVLVKGKDWAGKPVAGDQFVRSRGGQVCFIDLEGELSTTNIIQKIVAVYGGSS